MTAQLVDGRTREPRRPHAYADMLGRPLTTAIDADANATAPERTTAGTLWEREAERAGLNSGGGRLNYRALNTNQWERMCDARNRLGTHAGRRFVRGVLAADPRSMAERSGVIVSGQRRRVTAAAIYRHTGFECGAL